MRTLAFLFTLTLPVWLGMGCISRQMKNHPTPAFNQEKILIPLFEKAVPVADPAAYRFLTNALDYRSAGAQVKAFFHIDLNLPDGPLLAMQYELSDTEPNSRHLAIFMCVTNRGFRLVGDLQLYYGHFRNNEDEDYRIYVSDADGDSRAELLSFHREAGTEQLEAFYRYDLAKRCFVYHPTDRNVGVKFTPSFHKLAPLTPQEYVSLRCQGPVHLGGYTFSEYNIQQAKVVFRQETNP